MSNVLIGIIAAIVIVFSSYNAGVSKGLSRGAEECSTLVNKIAEASKASINALEDKVKDLGKDYVIVQRTAASKQRELQNKINKLATCTYSDEIRSLATTAVEEANK